MTVASVGDSLTSHTKDVQPISVTHGGNNYVFVDTPGLNNTMADPTVGLLLISNWLKSWVRCTL
jgi:hypothetical protein